MKIIFILQARENSKRLKNKSLLPIFNNKSSIDLIIDKIKKTKKIDDFFLATGPKKYNSQIFEKFNHKIKIFFGSEKNVRDRFTKIINKSNADIIIRATADNPLFDIKLLNNQLRTLIKSKKKGYSKYEETSIPFGSGVEIFKKTFYFKYLNSNNSSFAKEHVTVHMFNKKGSLIITPKKNFFPVRLTLDNLEDYKFIKFIYKNIKDPDIYKIEAFFKKFIK